MSPSRGVEPIASPGMASSQPESKNLTTTERTANIRSSTALTSLKHNIHYLISPSSATSPRPARLRTRALLRSLHYVSVFVFWRVVRYAKYAAVGSIVALLSATTLGSFATGIGWIVAPTGVVGCVGMGLLWWVGKWGFRRTGVGKRWEKKMKIEVQKKGNDRGSEGEWRDVTGPKAVPW